MANKPTDTVLLDWLSSLPADPARSRWKLRRSAGGQWWLLRTTIEQPNYATPREALIAAYEDCRQELEALDRLLGDPD